VGHVSHLPRTFLVNTSRKHQSQVTTHSERILSCIKIYHILTNW